MNCPACNFGKLKPMMNGDVELDVCEGGCGGIWFDHLELKKMDEPHEHVGAGVLQIAIDPKVKVDHQRKRNCPSCDNAVMFRAFFSAKREVEIDNCRLCGGFWLDPGELQQIRNSFGSEEDKKKHATQMYDEMFGADLKAMKSDTDESLAAAKKVANILKFICPSYYIPGKQDGGAF